MVSSHWRIEENQCRVSAGNSTLRHRALDLLLQNTSLNFTHAVNVHRTNTTTA